MGLVSPASCFWIILSLFAWIGSCDYNINNPPKYEIFDPAEADPRGEISCSGPPPPFLLDSLKIPGGEPVDPSNFTLQEICAKPQYGGKGPYMHAGGYCLRYGDWAHVPRLVFDSSTVAKVAPRLQHTRVLNYCQLRCYCKRVTLTLLKAQLEVQTRQKPPATIINPQQQTLDPLYIVTDYWRYYSIFRSGQLSWQLNGPYRGIESVATTRPPDNHIQCLGAAPGWLFNYADRGIGAYSREVGRNAQTLCANALEGGNIWYNAGGYCYVHQDGTRAPAFAEELTPHPSLTYTINAPQSLVIRGFCYEHCVCPQPKKRKKPEGEVESFMSSRLRGAFEFVQKRQLGLATGRGVNIYIDEPGASKPIPLVRSAKGGPQILVGACPNDNKRWCDTPWPTDLLGVPQPSAAIDPPLPQDDELVDLKTCGQTCRTHDGCSSSWESGCRCVIQKTVPVYEPIDPVFPTEPTFPSGRCMQLPDRALISSLMSLGGHGLDPPSSGSSSTRLGARGVDESPEVEWSCPCNSTFVSEACCRQQDGFV